MNFFSYLGKTKDSTQDELHSSSLVLEEKQLFTAKKPKYYHQRIKRLLDIDSTKEALTNNEILTYVQYDIKLNDLLYKSG